MVGNPRHHHDQQPVLGFMGLAFLFGASAALRFYW